jgi:hypothetical protein
MLTQSEADAFRNQYGIQFHVGDRMTWQFYREETTGSILPAGRITFRIAAIVSTSPALSDQFDAVSTAIITPAATARVLSVPTSKGYEWGFGWAALRLRDGDAGVPALQSWLDRYEKGLPQAYGPVTLNMRRLAIVKQAAQQAIEPQALALAVLGGLAALALLILMAQGLAQLLSRPAADALTFRALGASRPEAGVAQPC